MNTGRAIKRTPCISFIAMFHDMMNKKQFMIVIVGATGVGKSDFASRLAEYLPIEIVNADLGQFYQPLTIGTAKPLWQKDPIRHHLFDIYSEPKSCTVMEYRALVVNCLHDIWQRDKIPVIVGDQLFMLNLFFLSQPKLFV